MTRYIHVAAIYKKLYSVKHYLLLLQIDVQINSAYSINSEILLYRTRIYNNMVIHPIQDCSVTKEL